MGRTANDVKNYWNTHVLSRTKGQKTEIKDGVRSQHLPVPVIKPQPRTLSKPLNICPHIKPHETNDGLSNACNTSSRLVSSPTLSDNQIKEYLDELFDDREKEMGDCVEWPLQGVTGEGEGLFSFPIDDNMWDPLD
ncbi:hypothetical protein L1987_05633 [Smallanthus sonchifolius]|uniref:Uncharacterized protein n=1 Tax=Smallanthus sonchifolius TaxID=185202 RepID=A0ACB9JW20_9ASTR|nr:hypothetical protein L1987_05633 [Smallanthus sonchifolius]